MFTPKIGEDEPILTNIFFKGVVSTTNQKIMVFYERPIELMDFGLPENQGSVYVVMFSRYTYIWVSGLEMILKNRPCKVVDLTLCSKDL